MAGVDEPKRSAIIIAAWRASEWIGQCLDSWSEVSVPAGWEIDIRIGVDGCPETAQTLETLGTPYRYSTENVGPFLIRNALIEEAPADCYTIFDADDRVLPCHHELLLPLAGKHGVSAGARYVIDAQGVRRPGAPKRHSNGIIVISHAAWRKIGGFQPWRIAADTELHARLPRLGIPKRTTGQAVYERRVHPGSLTQDPETGFGSAVRKAAKARIRDPEVRRGRTITPQLAVFA